MRFNIKKIVNYHFFTYFLPVIILLFSLSTYLETNKRLRERDENLFEYRTLRALTLINSRLSDYFQILKGAQGLFEASDSVTRENWRDYVKTLDVHRTYPGIMGIGYTRYLRPHQIEPFVEAVRSEGFPNFKILPDGERSIYTSIVYLEPFEGKNLKAFGFDMFSEPVRRKAMERARDTKLPTISGKVQLVQNADEKLHNGFLAYLPVYQKGTSPSTVEECRRLIKGYVYNPFNMNEFINGALTDKFVDLDLEVYDGATISSGTILYNSDSILDYFANKEKVPFSKKTVLYIGQHAWTLSFFPKHGFGDSPTDSQPYVILLVGSLISILVFAVLYSFTNIKKSMEELSKAQTLLKEKNEELMKTNFDLDSFIYTASHDLKSPIVNLEGLLYNLEKRLDEKLEGHEKKVLGMMETSILRLKRTINDLADVTKVQKNINDGIEHVSFEEILQDVREDLDKLIVESGAQITEQIAVKNVHFARKNLRSIFYNLLSNAVKFRSPGQPLSILIKTERVGNEVLLTVKDNGMGISKSQHHKLFGMFKRFHQGTEGTGIGLYIVKRIIENNKGRIEVESDEGEGSTFRIYFSDVLKNQTDGKNFQRV